MKPTVQIIRYPNRKLYNKDSSSYVKLNEIIGIIKEGNEIEVIDNATQKDLTNDTLAKLLSKLQLKREDMLSIIDLHG